MTPAETMIWFFGLIYISSICGKYMRKNKDTAAVYYIAGTLGLIVGYACGARGVF